MDSLWFARSKATSRLAFSMQVYQPSELFMKLIPLTRGYFAMVDDEDFEFLNQYKWFAVCRKHTVYPKRKKRQGKKHLFITMASELLKVPEGMQIDHRDRNGLNAQKCNLRMASPGQQLANQGLKKATLSGFKGVRKKIYKTSIYYDAKIRKDGRDVYCGCFDDPRKAAAAYDAKAIELWGEFACTNKMLGLL